MVEGGLLFDRRTCHGGCFSFVRFGQVDLNGDWGYG